MAPMILKIKSKLLLWCSKSYMIWLLSAPPPLPPGYSSAFSYISDTPGFFFFFNYSRIYQDCSYLKAFVLSLKSSFHTGFLLAGSQFKYHLFKKSCITTYSDFLTQVAYYMPNSHHYLELSCTYLLTCLSISALTVYLNSLRARTLFMLLSKA